MEDNNSTAKQGTSQPRRRTRRSHSIAAEADRHIIRPAKRAVKSATKDISKRVSSLPGWAPWVAGALGVGVLVYGLFQMEVVRDFMRPVTEPITDFFSDEEEFDEDEFEDDSEGSDYGMNNHDSLSSGL